MQTQICEKKSYNCMMQTQICEKKVTIAWCKLRIVSIVNLAIQTFFLQNCKKGLYETSLEVWE